MKLTIYRGSEKKTIAAVDYSGAWIAHGWTTVPPEQQAIAPQPSEPVTSPSSDVSEREPRIPALELINGAKSAAVLTPLPGIGLGAGRRIIEGRPVGGYEAIAQIPTLCPELNRNPFSIDWAEVEAWVE